SRALATLACSPIAECPFDALRRLARPLRPARPMSLMPRPLAPVAASGGDAVTYHGAVTDFKRRLIEATLHQARGNRTHAARALGLQRTYLLLKCQWRYPRCPRG